MFEKEIEEIANKICALKICFNNCNFNSPKHHRCGEWHRCYESAKDGVEFGYNKANEWHKQDIDNIYDFIAEDWSVKYFICIMNDKSRVTATGICDEACNGEVSVNLEFDHNDERYCFDDIVWWKEIVLPKLKEHEK